MNFGVTNFRSCLRYVVDPHGIGAYHLTPLDTADRLLNTFPTAIDGQFPHGLFARLASQEP